MLVSLFLCVCASVCWSWMFCCGSCLLMMMLWNRELLLWRFLSQYSIRRTHSLTHKWTYTNTQPIIFTHTNQFKWKKKKKIVNEINVNKHQERERHPTKQTSLLYTHSKTLSHQYKLYLLCACAVFGFKYNTLRFVSAVFCFDFSEFVLFGISSDVHWMPGILFIRLPLIHREFPRIFFTKFLPFFILPSSLQKRVLLRTTLNQKSNKQKKNLGNLEN